MKGRFSIIFLLIFILLAFQSNKDANLIFWSSEYKLNWDDFKGIPKSSSTKKAAVSSVGINYSSEIKEGHIEFVIKAEFDRKRSWAKKGEKNKSLLSHEQGHFDLTEIYARKFRKSIKEKKFKRKNSLEDAREIRSINEKSLWEEQALYDSETDHSKIEAKQAEWEEKIKKQLQELEEFSDTLITITLK